MVPLRELKVKSAVGVEDKGDSIQAAEHHVYTVLKNSTIGPTTSLFQHLEHRYSLRRTQATVNHDY